MADTPATLESNPSQPEPETPNPISSQHDQTPVSAPPQPQSSTPSSAPIPFNPNSNAPPLASAPPPPHVSYAPSQVFGGAMVPPAAPSFWSVPQFSPMPNPGLTNPNYQNPGGVQPPGVSMAVSGGVGAAPVSVSQPMLHYQFPPGQPPRPYPPPMPNGYPAVPQGTIPPPVS